MISKITKRIILSFIPIIIAIVSGQAVKNHVPVPEKIEGKEVTYKWTCRARVMEIEKDPSAPSDQRVTVLITNGPFKDRSISFKNTIYNNPYVDKYMKSGDMIFCEVNVENDKISDARAIDFVRTDYILYSVGIFFFFIILICGAKSLRIIFSLLLSFCLLYFLVVLIKKGFDPISTTIVISFLVTLATFKLVAKINVKVLSAASGTILSLIIVGVVTYFIIGHMKYTGLDIDIGRIRIGLSLWGLYGSSLDYQKIIVAGIIFGALGALMDISMVVASAVNELKVKYEALSFPMAVKSGLTIGRDVLGTTTNTLIFAYTAHDITLLVLIFLQTRLLNDNVAFLKFFNFEEVSIESVRIIMGTIGLLLAVPLTIWVVSYTIRFYHKDSSRKGRS